MQKVIHYQKKENKKKKGEEEKKERKKKKKIHLSYYVSDKRIKYCNSL
jgi:hypothetical protein